MILRILVILLVGLFLGSCTTSQQYFYDAATGLRVDANPELLTEFQKSKVICDGKAAQAALASTVKTKIEHAKLVNLVYNGCMREGGYVVR